MRPVDLASELNIDAKPLRQWLRDHYAHEHGTPWDLTPEQEAAARGRFAGGSPSRTGTPLQSRSLAAPKSPGRTASDESYVIDLCDEILGETASRQHRFPWLQGDAGLSGNRVLLPVDAYYPGHRLVVEYRERQHFTPTPFFDRRETVSGVGRGEQRQIYDRRRETEVPAHDLRLVLIAVSDLRSNAQGRLLRDRASDSRTIRDLVSL